MKRFFQIIGLLVVLALVAGAISLFFAARAGRGLDAESKQFVDTIVPQIAAQWDIAIVNQYLDHETMAKVGITDDQMKNMVAWFSTLGKMTSYEGSQGEAIISYMNGEKTIRAQYIAKANFEKGPATFKIILTKNAQAWKIAGLFVNSPALIPKVRP